jgi:hypothetical protein
MYAGDNIMTHKTIQIVVLKLGLLGSLVGCPSPKDTQDSGDTGGTITATVENEGYACLMDDGTDDLSTGTVWVVLADCLSGCAHNLVASCEAFVDGDTIQVTAIGEYSVPTGTMDCPAMCVELSTECPIDGISVDVTLLRYADKETRIDYPTSTQTCNDASR